MTIGIFGSGIDPQAIGWVEATSEADDLTGFFQVLDFDISFLDEADLPVPDSRLIFQDVRVDQGFSTTAYLLNPNGPGTASVELSLVTPESVKARSLEKAAKGIVELNVEEFFEGVEPAGEIASEAYLIADSNVEIAGFELVGKEGEDLLGLNARPAGELLTTLFFPQLAVLGPFITQAVIGNFSEEAAIVTMTAFRENGDIYTDEVENTPVVLALDSGEILRADLEETFGFSGKTTLEGWLKVESTSASINGSISYSIPSLGTDVAAHVAAVAVPDSEPLDWASSGFHGVSGAGSVAENLHLHTLFQDDLEELPHFELDIFAGGGQNKSRACTGSNCRSNSSSFTPAGNGSHGSTDSGSNTNPTGILLLSAGGFKSQRDGLNLVGRICCVNFIQGQRHTGPTLHFSRLLDFGQRTHDSAPGRSQQVTTHRQIVVERSLEGVSHLITLGT